jgi:spore germination protein YaaH
VRVTLLARALAAVTVYAVVAGLAVVSTAPARATAPAPRRIVTGWLPYWSTSTSTAALLANKDLFTDASPFWFTATSAATISPELDAATRTSVTARVHAAGVAVYPTVTDGLPAHRMAAVLANPTSRTQHVNALLAVVGAGGYDGIDLDYEKFAFTDGSSTWASTRPSWVAFIAQLGDALHSRGKKLTVDVPYMTSPTTGYWVYDYAQIGPFVDRLRIMTYDFSFSHAGPIAPISWVRSVAAFAVTQVAASKVQIGVPTYGRDWPSSTTGCPVDNLPRKTSYTATQAAALAASLKVATVWNTTYDERTFSYPRTYTGHSASGTSASCRITRTVWYDDRGAVLARAHLVGAYHLGGIALWTVGGEDAGQWPLLRSYATTIKPDVSDTRISLGASRVAFGGQVLIRGLVTRGDDGTPIAGARVQLEARRLGTRTWDTLQTTTASASGVIRLTHLPAGATQYRLLTLSAFDHYAGYSAVVTAAVSRSVTVSAAPTTVVHGTKIVLSGVARPAVSGLRVYLQRWTGSAYVVVGSTLAAVNGRYSFPLGTTTPGAYGARTFVYGGAGYAGCSTARVTVTVT